MQIRFLGTAAAEGWPALFCHCDACKRARSLGGKDIRTRAQAVIDETVLMDLGPDTYLHMLYRGLDLPAIHTVLVTHAHQDHWYPQELLLRGEPYAHQKPETTLTAYGCSEVRAVFEQAAAQNDSPTFENVVHFKEVKEFEPFTVEGDYRITPLLAKHNPAEKCLLYLIEKDGKTVFYANDSGLYPEQTWDYLKGCHVDLVSFDCTNMLHPDGSYHMGLPAAIQARDRLVAQGTCNNESRFVLTHFSHNGKLSHAEIEQIAAKEGFATAYDGYEASV